MPRLFPSILLALFLVTHAFADSATWLGERVAGSGDWNNFVNWLGPAPGIYPHKPGDTASLTFPTVANGIATINTATTVGVVNIGTTHGANHYAIAGTNSAVLTLDNSGSGAQINQIFTSAGDIIAVPLLMNDNLAITNSATNTLVIGSGGHDAPVTSKGGARNLTIAANDAANIVFVDNSPIDISGTLTNAGAGAGAARIQGGMGRNITTINQASASSPLIIASRIAVNPAGTTIIDSGGGPLIAEAGISGTGNVILDNNSAVDENLHLGGAATTGTVTNSGNGIGNTEIGGSIGPGVRDIVQASATSGLDIRSGILTINGAARLTNNGAAAINFLQSTAGAGNLIVACNGSGGININEATLNHTGLVINSGTGSGVTQFGPNNSSLGSRITGIVQDSVTSPLLFRDGNFSGNGFAGSLTVKSGTLQFAAGADLSGASRITVGDTPAAGPSSFLSVGQLNGDAILTFGLGNSQTLSGFGTVIDGNVYLLTGRTLAPGSKTAIGALAFRANLKLARDANLDFILGANGAASRVIVGGQLTLPGKDQLNLNLVDNAGANAQGSLAPGTYELMTYTSLSGATPGDITPSFHITAPGACSYTVTATAAITGKIKLTVTPRPK